MKKFLAVCLTAFLMFNSTAYALSSLQRNDYAFGSIEMLIIDDLFEDETFAESLDEHLISVFGEEFLNNHDRSMVVVNEIYSLFPSNRLGYTVYPEFFGGMFIDEYGNLVVHLINDEVARTRSIQDLGNIEFILEQNVIISHTNHSYNYLNRLIEYIHGFMLDNAESYVARYVSHMYLSVRSNKVVVALNNYNEDIKALFRHIVTDSPAIKLTEAQIGFGFNFQHDHYDLVENSLYLEDNICVLSIDSRGPITARPGMGVDRFTIGYRAAVNGVQGVVTAGHAVYLNQRIGLFGTVTGRMRSINVDAAFIEVTENVTLSNNFFMQEGQLNPWTTHPVEGARVTMLGARTGSFQSGIISSTNFAYSILTGLVLTDVFGQEGDSGGPVFTGTAASNNLIGIITGGRTGGGHGAFFTRESNIRSALRAAPF
jgi:hypothetical protein